MPPHRTLNPDGTRACSIFGCGRLISVSNGSVVAGDYLLFLRGQIAADQIRERCSHCAILHTLRRDGYYGPWVRWACAVRDAVRWLEWQYQRRFYPVRFGDERRRIRMTLAPHTQARGSG